VSRALQLLGLQDFPLVEPGDDLAQLLPAALEANDLVLEEGDVLVLAQKIVSKAEGRYVHLSSVAPGPAAMELAAAADKDPRQAELILRESSAVLRRRPGVIIVEHKLGYVHANAGIDKSNLPENKEDPAVLLLPEDPDGSAELLRRELQQRYHCTQLAVIINDSAGRAWRMGTVGMAIGTAGIEPLRNQIGEPDLFGRALEVTEVAVADELAAAASFVMGQAAEGCPVVLIRGAHWRPAEVGSAALLRDPSQDMFR
jgi:coenzyme F420-0:L-glutamate ligase/coenzyme F420-1:gamma-L-glutamate ligase